MQNFTTIRLALSAEPLPNGSHWTICRTGNVPRSSQVLLCISTVFWRVDGRRAIGLVAASLTMSGCADMLVHLERLLSTWRKRVQAQAPSQLKKDRVAWEFGPSIQRLDGTASLLKLSVRDIDLYMKMRAPCLRRKSLKDVAERLRSLLRYMHWTLLRRSSNPEVGGRASRRGQ